MAIRKASVGCSIHSFYTLIEDAETLENIIGGVFGRDLGQAKPHKLPHRGIAVATNKRVLMVDKGMFGSTEVAEIAYENIEAITYSTGVMAGGLRITGRGTASFRIETIFPKAAAKLFADCVRLQMSQQRGSNNKAISIATEPVTSSVDEIEKCASLLERGFLTQDEFDAKKAQLLGL